MERVMTVEERIKKAEDIYNKRNGQYTEIKGKNKDNSKKKSKIIKKMIIQIFVCLMIYGIWYAFINKDYIFTEEFREQINQIFTQNEKINEMYSNVKSYIMMFFFQEKTEEVIDNQNSVNDNTLTEDEAENVENGIGGSGELIENTQNEEIEQEENQSEASEEISSEKSQMEKDADEIKSIVSFIVPVEGTISSTFGWRTPTTLTVPKYHTGLDIATSEGTKIKSATDGTVILVSSEGDYGKHYQIQYENIIIIYAHCKTLYLEQGDTVVQGQEIAEVGSTGNSTGPHLHFEIRFEDRLVDPQLVLDI